MIPYGKNNKFRYNYPDFHPQKGWVNWWEVELGGINKGSARQQAKIILRKELDMANTNNTDDCNCGKPLKLTDPKRKIVKKIKKRINPK
jgi:hypothetical protein